MTVDSPIAVRLREVYARLYERISEATCGFADGRYDGAEWERRMRPLVRRLGELSAAARAVGVSLPGLTEPGESAE